MRGMTDWRLIQAVYQLLLGLWVGAMVMLVVGATAAFGFIRGLDGLLLVSLEGWSDPLVDSGAEGFLAGGFVGAMLERLVVLQIVCGLGLGACVLAQFVWFPGSLIGGRGAKRQGVRVFLLAVPTVIVLFNLLVVTPGIEAWRGPFYDPDVSPERAALAEANFDWYHQMSTRTYGVSTLMLIGALVMGPWCLRPPAPETSLALEDERAGSVGVSSDADTQPGGAETSA